MDGERGLNGSQIIQNDDWPDMKQLVGSAIPQVNRFYMVSRRPIHGRPWITITVADEGIKGRRLASYIGRWSEIPKLRSDLFLSIC